MQKQRHSSVPFFHYIVQSSLRPKTEVLSLWPSSLAAQPGFVSYLVRNQEDKFSHDTAQVSLSQTSISTAGVRRP